MKVESITLYELPSRDNRAESLTFLPQPKAQCENGNPTFSNETLQKKRRWKASIPRIIGYLSFFLLLSAISFILVWAIYDHLNKPNSTSYVTEQPHTNSSTQSVKSLNSTASITTLPTTATKYIEQTSTELSTTTTPTTTSSVTAVGVSASHSTTKYAEPTITFLGGQFNYTEARAECEKMGRQLAGKDDMYKAYEEGYERCKLGWLVDQHAGYVMQQSGAREACGEGRIGLIYSSLKRLSDKVNGVYCAPKNKELYPSGNYSIPLQHNRTINWWVTYDPADIFDLKHILGLPWRNHSGSGHRTKPKAVETMVRAMRNVYVCCRIIDVSVTSGKNSTFVQHRRPPEDIKNLANMYKNEFGNPSLKVYAQVTSTYKALMELGAATFNRTKTISDITNIAVDCGVDGLTFDYEPTQNYSRNHAVAYRDFLNELAEELEKHHIKLGVVIASWGILKYYDLYANSKCQIIGSMSNTYYGKNVTINLRSVENMLSWIDRDRLQIGVGTMHTHSTTFYEWTEIKMKKFLNELKKMGIYHLHLWPGNWNAFRLLKRYFVEELLQFVKEKPI